MLEYGGIRWGYAFLTTASYLPYEDVIGLMTLATEMYLRRQEERPVDGPNYEGRIFTRWKTEILAAFVGVHFDVELRTDKGKDRMAFLISEQTWNQGSDYRN